MAIFTPELQMLVKWDEKETLKHPQNFKATMGEGPFLVKKVRHLRIKRGRKPAATFVTIVNKKGEPEEFASFWFTPVS